MKTLRGFAIGLVLAATVAYAVTGSPTEQAIFGQLTVVRELLMGDQNTAVFTMTPGSAAPALVASTVRANAVPTTQTIAAGNTVTADACGGLKLITAAGAVTTSTTATFTAPATGNKGCQMFVYNTGANAITLDNQAAYTGVSGADVVLAQDEGVCVVSLGATRWISCSPKISNHV